MDPRERYDNFQEMLRLTALHQAVGMYTALPGIVESFNPALGTVSVQPAIRSTVQDVNGAFSNVSIPLLADIPVCFPGGGGCTLTFPVAKGDECLLVFASRDIDSWWETGSVQNPSTGRIFDLSDAFAIVGVRSKPRALAVATTGAQLKANDGATVIEVSADGARIDMRAPNGVHMQGQVFIDGTLDIVGELRINGISLGTHMHDEHDGGHTGVPINEVP